MPKLDEQVRSEIETEDAFESVNSEAEGVIRGVKLLGLRSRNKRNYDTPGVRKTGVSLLEGAQVYIDHPKNPQDPRSYRDKIGHVKNVQFRPGAGHFGDIHYNPKHNAAEQFLWDVKNSPTTLGMSINAKFKPGKTDRNGDQVVESLEMVRSVDIVTKPATADGIFEHETEDDDMPLTVAELKEKHKDIVEQLLAEHSESKKESDELVELRRVNKEALEQLNAIKAEAEAKKLRDAVESEYAKIFEGKDITAEVLKDIVECACQLPEESRKKMAEVVGKLGPMLVEVPDSDEDEVPDDADEQEHEEKPEPLKPAIRPGKSKSSKMDFKRDILGIS